MSVSSTPIAVVLVQEPAHQDLCLFLHASRILRTHSIHVTNTAPLLAASLLEQEFILPDAPVSPCTCHGLDADALRQFAGVYGLAFWQVQQLAANTASLGLRHWLRAILWHPYECQLAMRAPIPPRKAVRLDCRTGRL